MHCHECQKETICQYGLVSPPGTNYFDFPEEKVDRCPVFCSKKCMNLYLRSFNHLWLEERRFFCRIAELEKQVAELQTQLNQVLAQHE